MWSSTDGEYQGLITEIPVQYLQPISPRLGRRADSGSGEMGFEYGCQLWCHGNPPGRAVCAMH
jgi:hypothetical protein